MKNIITIVGCGAVGVSQLYHLVDQLINDNIAANFEILIFEKSSSLGQGVAYIDDYQTNILNRTAGTMSLIHGKPDDFIQWLKNNKSKWKNKYSCLKQYKLKDAFLPRSLFGMYSEDILRQTIYKARKHKLKISFIHDEVVLVQKYEDKYRIKTKNGWQLISDILILALGNLPSNKLGDFKGNDKYFTAPYPTQQLDKIPTSASVGILGSRLSAIDAAISLNARGHTGGITFIARKGYFPSIRSPYQFYQLNCLSEEAINQIAKENKKISLKQVVKMLIAETESICGIKLSFKKFFRRTNDLKIHLENEFNTNKSKEKMVWQNMLIALNNVIEKIWHHLNDSDRELFNNVYKSQWTACRVGIPIQNAKKIYSLVKNKKLTMLHGCKHTEYADEKFSVITEAGRHTFDYLIDATGNCDDLKLVDSPLLTGMLNEGLIERHKFGGVKVEFESSKVINNDNYVEHGLFVIGNLASGTYFFTSVLELNIKHAFNISKNISKEFIQSYRQKYVLPEITTGYVWQKYADKIVHQHQVESL